MILVTIASTKDKLNEKRDTLNKAETARDEAMASRPLHTKRPNLLNQLEHFQEADPDKSMISCEPKSMGIRLIHGFSAPIHINNNFTKDEART